MDGWFTCATCIAASADAHSAAGVTAMAADAWQHSRRPRCALARVLHTSAPLSFWHVAWTASNCFSAIMSVDLARLDRC